MSYNINAPAARAYFFEDFQFTYFISGTIDPVNDIGKAVSWDTTTDDTVKLAADGDKIIGRLEAYENRTQEKVQVATVSRKFKNGLPVKPGLTGAEIVARGVTVVGAGAGLVKAGTASTDNIVTSVGTLAHVEKF